MNNQNSDLTIIQQRYIQFLEGYVVAGHTCTDEAKNEIDEITRAYVLSNEDDYYYYFKRQDIKRYLNILKTSMNDYNKSFFEESFYFNDRKFENHLANFIKHYLSQ